MHYFSIHTQQGEHLGFLIMLPDDESEMQPQSGHFIIKIQSEMPPQDKEAVAVLLPFEQNHLSWTWRVMKERVELFDEAEQNIGSIRNEYLMLLGQILVLNDLTGMM